MGMCYDYSKKGLPVADLIVERDAKKAQIKELLATTPLTLAVKCQIIGIQGQMETIHDEIEARLHGKVTMTVNRWV